MSEQDIIQYGEVQYLRGRLDELHKALPTITNINRSRKVDVRIQKYYDKLKATDEVAYYLYLVERQTRQVSKERNQRKMGALLQEILKTGVSEELKIKIIDQLDTY
jgi:hypothetical protein